MNKRLTNIDGLTLIELLVAIAVLVILLTVALPSLIQSFNRQKIYGIGDNFHFLLRYAKVQSSKQAQQLWLRLHVDEDNSKNWRIALTDTQLCNFSVETPCLINDIERQFSSAQYDGVSMETNMLSISIDPTRGRGNNGTTTFSINGIDVEFRQTQFGHHKLCTNFSASSSRYPAC